MSLSETILFSLAKRLYRSELGHSSEMKNALQSENAYADFRSQQSQVVLNAAAACGIRIKGKIVVDFGCFDGAITSRYGDTGATHVYGIDIDKGAIAKARQHHNRDHVTFLESDVKRMPLDDSSVDVILCYDVFEHVAHPADMLHECYRILRPGGQLLIGTWGWYHPFAPHLWSTMPVPWAHVFFSERTLLRTCRRVYTAPWYQPNMHDLDAEGNRKPEKFQEESISTDYLNKYLIQDFERVFRESEFDVTVRLQPFGSKYASWTKPLLRIPYIREFFTAYLWATLTRPEADHSSRLDTCVRSLNLASTGISN